MVSGKEQNSTTGESESLDTRFNLLRKLGILAVGAVAAAYGLYAVCQDPMTAIEKITWLPVTVGGIAALACAIIPGMSKPPDA
ncbi:hypothetical protein FWC31_00535 [Candidatus Saccharibacteria bacterium]|nr:hypothetical protein [Candidatus Saccharibacteria bacterium]